jgi:small-conductance mechanosensitive channel
MMKRQEMWARSALRTLVAALLAAGPTGCVETGLYEKAALDLDGARRENGRKEQQIRELQWQLASAGQQLQALSQRDAAALASLDRRVQEASAANRALAERLKTREQEAEKLTLAVARAEEEASAKRGPPGPTHRLRPEELKRIEDAAGSRDAEVSKLLARVEKLLENRAARVAGPGGRPSVGVDGEIIDPWNGDRK